MVFMANKDQAELLLLLVSHSWSKHEIPFESFDPINDVFIPRLKNPQSAKFNPLKIP